MIEDTLRPPEEHEGNDFEERYGKFYTEVDGEECFMAGIPGYEGKFFGRDSDIAGFLDERLLPSALKVNYLKQGTKNDATTGEEPGKMPHEWPGAELADKNIAGREGYKTTYNACDTTALTLIGTELLEESNPLAYDEIVAENREKIEQGVDYILRHIDDDNVFREFPPPPADKFALRITYWKDSVLPQPAGNKEEPGYPALYTLAHFMNARGLLSAAKILDRQDLADKAADMFHAGIQKYVRADGFTVMEDSNSRLIQPSSDELHALAYIPEEYSDMLPFDAICERTKELETPAGFACTPKTIADQLKDKYHGNVVWPFENAMIDYAARKFDQPDIATVAQRSKNYIENGNELVNPDGTRQEEANEFQLWTVAADYYFTHDDVLLRRSAIL